jgi:hypothetical protein
MKLEQEQQYEIALSEENELMISIKERSGEPENSIIIYDGKDHALFYRDSGLTIVLDYIHPQVRDMLKAAKQVIIAEVDGAKEIKNAYEVPVKIVKSVPISKEDIVTLPEGQEPQYPDPEKNEE